ncbi:hypothetical protein OLZ33_19470 [Pantoea ananatis]|nr:hypothetical protein [Pantoea ananatis]
MCMSAFHDWLLEIADGNYFFYIKRLSANDTGATGGHQVGLYIPSGIRERPFESSCRQSLYGSLGGSLIIAFHSVTLRGNIRHFYSHFITDIAVY